MARLLVRLAFAGALAVTVASPLVTIPPITIPIVTPAQAATDPGPGDQSPYLTNARALIKAKKYDAALADLKVVVVAHQNADVYTLLGHAYWKTGDRANGMLYYNKALELMPTHRGALEYQGELYVAMGQMDKARGNLAKLKTICPFGCEELSDLSEAIEHAPK
jgi:tetratricopeptide (TPR) repeat protein